MPDVVALADPVHGFDVCRADRGGCPIGNLVGGTSLATPIWAALAAVLAEAQGAPLGLLNPALYPLAGTGAFHGAASLGSDAAHVGLGSPNGNRLYLALTGATIGATDAGASTVSAEGPDPFHAFFGAVLADGKSSGAIVVELRDALGDPIAGHTVTLAASAGSHAVVAPAMAISTVENGAAVFTITDATVEAVTFTATDATAGLTLAQTATLDFTGAPAASGGVFASAATATADGLTAVTITVTLLDAGGNPAPGKVVSVSQSGSSIIGGGNSVTDASGSVSFIATDRVAESVIYTAVDVSDGDLPIPSSVTVAFVGPGANPCHVGGGTPSGVAVTTFVGGFANGNCQGPIGLAFDAAGNLFVGQYWTRQLLRFGASGGTAGPANVLASISGQPVGLAFTADGRLYAVNGTAGEILSLDPATGATLRGVASVAFAIALAVDPLSGDLFVSSYFNGIYRVSGFAGGSGTVTPYVSGVGCNDGLAFGPDGTLYFESGCGGAGIYSATGTNTAKPGVATLIAAVPTADGVGVQPNPAAPGKPLLWVNRNDGTITRIDTSTSPPTLTDVFTGGSRGDFVTVGPDGCLYATQTDRVLKVTNADGTCSLAPTSRAPSIVLSPSAISPSPAQGTPETFTATLLNLPAPAGTPVILGVYGANQRQILGRTDASGVARFTYAGTFAGPDALVATVPSLAPKLNSNPARVTWVAGPHATFVDLNLAPSTGAVGSPTALLAVLTDVATSPPAALAGMPLALDLGGGATCNATTDAHGLATCSVTPALAGPSTVTASFAGAAGYLPSSGERGFLGLPLAATVQTCLAYTGPSLLAQSGDATLSAVLTAGVAPVANRVVTFTLGGGPSAPTCAAVTDGSGRAACALAANVPVGPASITVAFAGDATLLASSTSAAATVFAFPSGGAFVIGDQVASVGARVTFFGSSWSCANPLSGGPAPDGFDGFAPLAAPPTTCGAAWTSIAGAPPASLPAWLGVLVAGTVSANGGADSGTVASIVVVAVDPGYAPTSSGTGTILGIYCPN